MKIHYYLIATVALVGAFGIGKFSAPNASQLRVAEKQEVKVKKSWPRSPHSREYRGADPGHGVSERDMPPELKQFMSLSEAADEADLPGLYDKAMQFKGDEQKIALHVLAFRWCSLNPTGAADYALQIADSGRAEEFLLAVLSTWPANSIQRGFDWLASMEDGEKKQRMLEAYLFRAVKADPGSAAGYVASLPEGPQKSAMISQIIQTWARTAPDAAWNWASQSLSGISKSEALAAVGRGIANSDPARAAALLENIPFGLQRDNLLSDVASKWIEVDAKLAVGWLEGLDHADRKIAVMAMATGWAGSEPLEAVAFASNLPNDQRDQFLDLVARRWAEDDPSAAMKWATASRETLPSGILQSVFDSWSAKDPKKASETIKDFNDEKTQAELAHAVARNWARSDPNGASEFATSLPEGPAKAEAVGRLMTHWSRSDPMAASKWLNSLDPGQAKDKGIVELAFGVSKSDPGSALQWTQEISNQADRQKWMQRIGKEWINSQGEEAKATIMKMGFSSSELKQIGLE